MEKGRETQARWLWVMSRQRRPQNQIGNYKSIYQTADYSNRRQNVFCDGANCVFLCVCVRLWRTMCKLSCQKRHNISVHIPFWLPCSIVACTCYNEATPVWPRWLGLQIIGHFPALKDWLRRLALRGPWQWGIVDGLVVFSDAQPHPLPIQQLSVPQPAVGVLHLTSMSSSSPMERKSR